MYGSNVLSWLICTRSPSLSSAPLHLATTIDRFLSGHYLSRPATASDHADHATRALPRLNKKRHGMTRRLSIDASLHLANPYKARTK